MGDLGDLGNFMKDGSVPNLDWLEVSEEDYEKLETLPRQNLDVLPDLEAAWSHEGQPPSAYFVPNQAGAPRTMGDMSEVHGPLRTAPADIMKYARLLFTRTSDGRKIGSFLAHKFDRQSLEAVRSELIALTNEIGLLGNYYINASDLPGCHNSPKQLQTFVKQYASDTPFIKAKPECSSCVHAKNDNCSVFHKQIVLQVPYTPALADTVEKIQRAKGKSVPASENLDARERIRAAYQASDIPVAVAAQAPHPVPDPARDLRPAKAPVPIQIQADLTVQRKKANEAVDEAFGGGRITVVKAQTAYKAVASARSAADLTTVKESIGAVAPRKLPVYTGVGQQPPMPEISKAAQDEFIQHASGLMVERQASDMEAVAAHNAAPIIALLRREMLKGRSEQELTQALRLAFDERDLQATQAQWGPLFKQAGLYGVIFSTQESFSNCHEGADFLARHSSSVRAIIAGKKCEGCFFNKLSRCLLYGRKLAPTLGDVVNFETVTQVLDEHRMASRISAVDARQDWGSDPAQALRALHATATKRPQAHVERQTVQQAFHGNAPQMVTTDLTKRNLVEATRKYMNEGLYGTQLREALTRRFEARDIANAQEELRPILAEQGLQGIYYVDPTVHSDYGKGCDEAARLHRSRVVKFAKVGPACATCVLQRSPGHCSKLNKALVKEPPYEDKVAMQRAVLAEKSTEVPFEQLVNNGTTMVAEFEMQGQPLKVEVNDAPTGETTSIQFGTGEIKL